MEIWPFKRKKPPKPDFYEVDIYVRDPDYELLRLENVMNIAIALSQAPVYSYGIELPTGTWIAPSQYGRLPEHLKRYFKKTTTKVKSC